jgi:uncharacterized protein (TIGR00299 family) protein
MTRTGWLDCGSGVSGDMLLGALAGVGVLDALPDVLASAPGLAASIDVSATMRGALAGQRVVVTTADPDPPHRSRSEVRNIVDALPLPDAVRTKAQQTFDRLASAEARVHGVDVEAVQFHEVGAVDAIVDIVGVCLGMHTLGLQRLTVSPIALGGGTAETQHGPVPVPVPAVLELLRDSTLTAVGGDQQHELATPTGVALLVELADGTSELPEMSVQQIGVGAGSRDGGSRPNVLRLVVGEATAESQQDWLLVEANVDDLDPRLWPGVLDALLAAGAADAWLTPILMKKGRPANTVSALTTTSQFDEVRRALFVHSSTIGLRTTRVAKSALDRECIEVDVSGQCVRVKVARLEGGVVNINPEWEDVSAAAASLGRAAKDVLADATATARRMLA